MANLNEPEGSLDTGNAAATGWASVSENGAANEKKGILRKSPVPLLLVDGGISGEDADCVTLFAERDFALMGLAAGDMTSLASVLPVAVGPEMPRGAHALALASLRESSSNTMACCSSCRASERRFALKTVARGVVMAKLTLEFFRGVVAGLEVAVLVFPPPPRVLRR